MKVASPHMIYSTKNIKIFFGDKQTAARRDSFEEAIQDSCYDIIPPLADLKQNFSLRQIVALKQTHSVAGQIIGEKDQFFSGEKSGDFLITQRKNIGLFVYTADCLPVIFYDRRQEIIAIAHAGWQGTIINIAAYTFQALVTNYQCKPEDMQIIFGPSGQNCCYEVGPEFKNLTVHFSFQDKILSTRANKLYFDVLECNKKQLIELGIENFNLDYAQCTICSENYCSYRREKEKTLRQITLVALV